MCLKHAGCFLIVVKLEINGPRRLEVMLKKSIYAEHPVTMYLGHVKIFGLIDFPGLILMSRSQRLPIWVTQLL